MRVLMLSKACLVGAYQRKLEEIAAHPDVELMVVVPPAWNDGSRTVTLERAHLRGYQLIVEPLLFNGDFHLHFYPRLGRHLRHFRPDILHADEEPYNLATFHAIWLAKRAGVRALWFSWQNLYRRYPPPFRWMEQYNLRRADFAIVGSEGAAGIWRRKGYDGPLEVIPQFGVDPAIFTPRPPRRGDEVFTIGYVGRLVEEKGVDLLLRALGDVPGDWRLRVVGAGPERTRLETLTGDLGLGGRVRFERPIHSLGMPAFYRGLDALVLPSRSRPNWIEQFGRVLIEAMACGVPVIGSTCGEIPYVIGEDGLLFPEDDREALRDSLIRLMEEGDLWVALSRRGRERVLRRFTQAEVASRTVAVYRRMMG